MQYKYKDKGFVSALISLGATPTDIKVEDGVCYFYFAMNMGSEEREYNYGSLQGNLRTYKDTLDRVATEIRLKLLEKRNVNKPHFYK